MNADPVVVGAVLVGVVGVLIYWQANPCALVGHDEKRSYVQDGDRIHTDGSPYMIMRTWCRRCARDLTRRGP